MTSTVTTFRIGIAGQLHAIACDPLDRASGSLYPTACGAAACIASEWGAFGRGNPKLRMHVVCPHCAWIVALANGMADVELAAVAPSDAEAQAWVRLLPDPDAFMRACQEILTGRALERGYDSDNPRWAQLLGHVSAHRPQVLVSEGCSEGDCDHDGGCLATSTVIACPACSVQAGPWAGEWEGQYDITVAAPCSVLTTMAAATFE